MTSHITCMISDIRLGDRYYLLLADHIQDSALTRVYSHLNTIGPNDCTHASVTLSQPERLMLCS